MDACLRVGLWWKNYARYACTRWLVLLRPAWCMARYACLRVGLWWKKIRYHCVDNGFILITTTMEGLYQKQMIYRQQESSPSKRYRGWIKRGRKDRGTKINVGRTIMCFHWRGVMDVSFCCGCFFLLEEGFISTRCHKIGSVCFCWGSVVFPSSTGS